MNAEITGYGQYQVGLDFTGTATGKAEGISFTAVILENAAKLMPYTIVTVDKVEVNGSEIALGKGYANDEEGHIRCNLYNSWVSELPNDARRADGDLTDATPMMVNPEDLASVETIMVTFTLSEGEAPVVDEGPELPPVDKNGTYNAYFGVQTAAYSFRDPWDSESYGLETEYFNQITGWDADNNAVVRAGTIHDTVIEGNGTYSVSLTDFNFDDGAETLNLLYVSTDIPKTGEIVISNVTVFMDGKEVYGPSSRDYMFAEAFLDPDTKTTMKPLCINLWSSDLKKGELFSYKMPTTSIEIQFTVSGFDYDKAVAEEPAAEPTEAPAEEVTTPAPTEEPVATEAPKNDDNKSEEPKSEDTSAPAEEESSFNAVPIVIAAVVAVIVIVAAVVAVARKKKSAKPEEASEAAKDKKEE